MAAAYLWMATGTGEGSATAVEREVFGVFLFVQIGAVGCPLLVRNYLSRTGSYRAAWILFSSPGNLRRLAQGGPVLVTAFFIVPFMMVTGVVLGRVRGPVWLIREWMPLALWSYFWLRVQSAADPVIPFTRAVEEPEPPLAIAIVLLAVASTIPFALWLSSASDWWVFTLAAFLVAAADVARNIGLRRGGRICDT